MRPSQVHHLTREDRFNLLYGRPIMKVTTPLEKRLYAALKRIAKNYAKPERIIRTAEKEWGSSPDEALSMAYENIQSEAAAAIKGVRVEKGSV